MFVHHHSFRNSFLALQAPLGGALALLASHSTHAGVVTWDGSCSTSNWLSTCGGGAMTNWNDDNLPTLNSIVSIPTGSPVVTITGNAAAGMLTCDTGLSIAGGSLELGAGGVITGLHMNTVSPFGIRLNGGLLSLAGGTNWEFGRVTGSGTVENQSLLLGRSMTLEGAIACENLDWMELAFLSLQAGCTFANTGDGYLKMSVPSPLTGTNINGAGTFYNSGILEFAFSGASHTIDLICPYVQLGGSLRVTGASPGSGARLEGDTLFSGGDITLSSQGNLHFRNDGGNATHVLDGIGSISGQGSMFISMLSTAGSDDFLVQDDVNINLTGAAGFTLASGEPVTLNAALANQGQMYWSGGTVKAGSCPTCSPEFRNQGTINYFTSGSVLDAWLNNMSGGTFVHEGGSLNLGDQGDITNHGTYEHRAGTIQKVSGTTSGTFTNYDQYIRPNIPQTQDVTVHAPFTLNPDSEAHYEKAITTYQTSGLFFNGGDAIVNAPGVVRVGVGGVESNNSDVVGTGEFHIGGVGGISVFHLGQSNLTLPVGVGQLGLPAGASTAGLYLDVGGRVSGPGRIVNNKRCFWNGGAVGHNGEGRLVNYGDVFLSSGQVIGANASFINRFGSSKDYGRVLQSGSFTINSSLVINEGEWQVVAPTNIQGFGSHEFFNDDGLFLSNPGSGNTVTVSAAFNNAGLVEVNTGTLVFTGSVAQVSAGGVGGRWRIVNGAALDLPGTISVVKPDGEIVVNGTWNDLGVIHTNQGILQLRAGNIANRFNNDGSITFMPHPDDPPVTGGGGTGTVNNSVLAYCNNVVVPSVAGGGSGAGGGAIPSALRCGTFNNHGFIQPGGPDAPGPFKIDANVVCSSTSVVRIDLAGAAPVDGHDQLIVDGNLTLDGTLHVKSLPGFVPESGQQFTLAVASNGTISGTFDQIIGFGSYSVAYGSNAVILTVVNAPTPGDTNGDGVVNVADLLHVIANWGLCPSPPMFCSGDLTGDGLVNVADLLTVIANWG